jgi:hypothetical protein
MHSRLVSAIVFIGFANIAIAQNALNAYSFLATIADPNTESVSAYAFVETVK